MGYLADVALRTMSQSGVAIRRDLLAPSCMALARLSTASAVSSLPAPPAMRRRSRAKLPAMVVVDGKKSI